MQYSTASPSTRPLYCSPTTLFHDLDCSHFSRRHYGNRICFLFLLLVRCFSSPVCLFPAHGFSSLKGWPIRESLDLCLFSTLRNISSLTTPFLVSECLGIHRKLFLVRTSSLTLRLCHPKVLLNGWILSTYHKLDTII